MYSPFSFFTKLKPLIPVMTSNTSPLGIASASSEQNPAYFAFDSSSIQWFSNTTAPAWVQYQFPYKVVARQYLCQSSLTTQTYQFQCSNDGSTWSTIDSQTSVQNIKITLSNNLPFIYYRLNITAGGNPNPQMNIFQIYGY